MSENGANSEYVVTTETLDLLFAEQLSRVRKLVFTSNCIGDADLCLKWFKVFSRTSKEEKMARNCLCFLMEAQLQENGYLSLPFTNLANCNRDLEQVLAECDDNATLITESIKTNFPATTILPRHSTPNVNIENQHTNDLDDRTNLKQELRSLELQLREKQEEINELRKELQEIGGEKQNEINELRTILRERIEQQQGTDEFIKELEAKVEHLQRSKPQQTDNTKQVKSNFIATIQYSLQQLQRDSKTAITSSLLQNICMSFFNDKEFTATIRIYDQQFEQIFNNCIEKELNARQMKMVEKACTKVREIKHRIREKYDHRLRVQVYAHKLHLKLTKLKNFSILRNILVDTKQNAGTKGSAEGTVDQIWSLLKVLEEKCKKELNDI